MQIESNNRYQPYLFLIILFLSCGLTFYGCSNKIEPQKKEPSKETSTKTRFPGTRAFAELPSNFVWDKEKEFYRFGETENHVRVMYFPVDFAEMKKEWKLESNSLTFMEMRTFLVEGQEAMITEGYDAKQNQQNYLLMMETEYHPLALMSKIKDTALISEMNIHGIIESLHHVDNFDLDLFELEDYQFDLDITGFQYYLRIGPSGRITFLRERIKDMDNLGPERITVSGKEKMTKEKVENLLKVGGQYERRTVVGSVRTDTLINNLKTSIVEIDYASKGQASYKLMAVIHGTKKDYTFQAITNRDIEEMKKKFRKTLESFKEKQ